MAPASQFTLRVNCAGAAFSDIFAAVRRSEAAVRLTGRKIYSALLVGLTLLIPRLLAAQGSAPPEQGLEREFGFLEAEDVEKIPLGVVSRGPAIPAGQAPAVVDVITAQEIRTSGARTLAELLAQRVGIDVSMDRLVSRGLNTAPSLQGFSLANNRTLLLIDGRPANGVFFGEFLAGRELPLEHIARIEIIRGPGSALYGTNAMAGVINVVTKDAADVPGLDVIGEYGSFSTRRADLAGGIGGPRRNGSFFFRYYGSGGIDEIDRNDDQREYFGFARSTLGPLTLEGEALNFRQELPGTEDEPTPQDRVNRERYSIGASLVQPVGDEFRVAGRAYANLHQNRFLVAAQSDEGSDRNVYEERRLGQELSLSYRPSSWLGVTFGGEVREENGEVGPFRCVAPTGPNSVERRGQRCELDQNIFAGYLENQIELPANLTLTAGFRFDKVEDFDGRFSPRANLLWRASSATSLKVGYGEAFRAPSFFERFGAQAFGSDLLGNPNVFVLGSPFLDPEVVRAVEGEIDHRVSRALALRASAFVTRGSDLITQVGQTELLFFRGAECPTFDNPPPLSLGRETFCFVNSSRVRVTGVELSAGGATDLPIPGELSYGINFTVQKSRNFALEGEPELPLSPDHKVNLLLDYRPTPDLSLFWHTRWVDRQFLDASNGERLRNFFNTNLNLVYRLSREIDVGVGLYNLFDDGRKEAGNTPREPRTILGSIAYRFAPGPRPPDLSCVPPPALGEARAAVERARALGAETLDLTSYKEALAHLLIAEEMQRRCAERERIVAAAGRALQAAELAKETAASVGVPATPSPSPSPLPPAPTPPPSEKRAPGKREETAAPVARPKPPVVPPVLPSPGRTQPTVAPTLPLASPTPQPTSTPTPTPTSGPRRVILLQSDSRVTVNGEIASALLPRLSGTVEFIDLAGDRERGLEVARKAAERADLVVTVGSLATAVARDAISTVPVIFCAALNPSRLKLPTANAGGVRFELSPKEVFARLKLALPGLQRIGVIFDPAKSQEIVSEAIKAAGAYGLQIVPAEAHDSRSVDFVFRSIRKEIQVLWIIPDSTVITRENWLIIREQAAESNIPLLAFSDSFAREGALLAFYPEPQAIAEQCAQLAGRVLRREISPAQIGIQAPERVSSAVNRRVEEYLGLKISPSLAPDREFR